MSEHLWIWQQPQWPAFTWNGDRLAALLRECTQAQCRLLGMSCLFNDATSLKES
uniref:DUF4172 domain-containing protein n=1 Tax=Pseudomonas viridiflava TaxID=33069 RepID=UPI00106FB7B8